MYARKTSYKPYKKNFSARKYKNPMERIEMRRSKPKGTILGKINGKVDPALTTMAKAQGPFASTKWTTLLYENGLTKMSGISATSNADIACNGAWDVDQTLTAIFGNKQPLYFDTLVTVSGPYKNYKVVSWETTYTIINQGAVPLNVYAKPSFSGTGELDSVAECENMPGVQKRYLTSKDGALNRCVVTVRGHIDDVYTGDNALAQSGTSSANPGAPIYGGVLVATADGTTAVDAYIAIEHRMYTLLYIVDALVS